MKSIFLRLAVGLLTIANLSGQKQIQVIFQVTVPAETDRVVIVGNVPAPGNWDNTYACQLIRIDSCTFRGEVALPLNEIVEYKITRGSWQTEALEKNDSIPGNQVLRTKNDTTVYHKVFNWKETVFNPGTGITGEVRYHPGFYSPQLDNKRDITVWLPPNYNQASENNYPVLYMHDGQNIFNPFISFGGNEWQLDETATAMIEKGIIREIVIVGISSTTDRTAEYSPEQNGKKYSNFLVNSIIPFIESNYHVSTDPRDIAVMGSSMGGIISFHLAWEYPQVFSMAGCLSPAFLVDSLEIVDRVKKYHGLKKNIRLVIYSGTEDIEVELQPAITKMVGILAEKDYRQGSDFIYKNFTDAGHNEQA